MTNLKRKRHPMPEEIRTALLQNGVMDLYEARPPYQRNDYIGWIIRAKREATRQKRLAQMIAELQDGALYMNMPWQPKARK